MTHQQTVHRLRLVGIALILAAMLSLVFAATADALTVDPDDQGVVAEEADQPSELPAAPEPPADVDLDVVERIATVPPDEPFFPAPATTLPPRVPNVDAANFGVGWPAAIAAGIAVLSVLIMALTWRRDEPAWVRRSERR